MPTGSATPWSYVLVRLLFRFVASIFYGNIVVENAHFIPETGRPCIICPNHGNSFLDGVLLVGTVPTKRRDFLRLAAKATLFGRKTFISWFIKCAAMVPIKRRKDYPEGTDVDNTESLGKLMDALEMGDAVCIFPEGMSRYHPSIAPLKTGVARMVSEVLTRNRDNPCFEISVVSCSFTYMHRQHFRSDVLLTFHKPMVFRPKNNPELLAPADHQAIRNLTDQIHQGIASGTWDAPSWDLIRTAKFAARIYAPLGTAMMLGDYVRLSIAFLNVFKTAHAHTNRDPNGIVMAAQADFPASEVEQLRNDLKVYQEHLTRWGIKDDRLRRPLRRHIIVLRLVVRLIWAIFLFALSFPGLLLWLPVFIIALRAVRNYKKTGPIQDTWDEIAQYKCSYGLASGFCVWALAVALTWTMAPITIFLVPSLMWMTLRWFEDATSALRAFVALFRLLWIGKSQLKAMREKREDLLSRVMNVAVNTLGLPDDPESYFRETGGQQKGRIRGRWSSGVRYFSIKRRRKRDWNEALRLYEVDYPENE